MPALLAPPALAQPHGAIEAASEATFRGRSVSAERPVATLSLGFDAPAGFYIGGAGSVVATSDSGLQLLGGQVYGGYAKRLAAGPTLDLGVVETSYTEYYGAVGGADFPEVYVGLIGRNLSARISYSPDYFGRGRATLYSQIDAAVRLAPAWRLAGHVGLLNRLESTPHLNPSEYDWRLGLTRGIGPVAVQVAWVGAGPDPGFYGYEPQSRQRLVVSASYPF